MRTTKLDRTIKKEKGKNNNQQAKGNEKERVEMSQTRLDRISIAREQGKGREESKSTLVGVRDRHTQHSWAMVEFSFALLPFCLFWVLYMRSIGPRHLKVAHGSRIKKELDVSDD